MLLLWSALVAFVVGFAYLMFRGPLVPGLLVMGAVLAVSLWWGPGSRRLRLPTRRVVLTATRRAWTGWFAVALVVAAAVLCGWPWRAAVSCGTRSPARPGAPGRCSAAWPDWL